MSNEPTQATYVGQLWHYLQWLGNASQKVYQVDPQNKIKGVHLNIADLSEHATGNVDEYLQLAALTVLAEKELIACGVPKRRLSQFQKIKIEIAKRGHEKISGTNLLHEDTLNYLEILHESITNDISLVEQKDLEDIKNQVESLFDDVTKMDFADNEQDLREFLLEHIAKLKQALDQYFIHGSEGISDALASLVGDLTLKPNIADKLFKSRFGKPLRNIFFSVNLIMGAINVGTTITANTVTIQEHFKPENPQKQLNTPTDDAKPMNELEDENNNNVEI